MKTIHILMAITMMVFVSGTYAQPMKADDSKICDYNDPMFIAKKFAKLKTAGAKKVANQPVYSEPKECPKKGDCAWKKKESMAPGMKMLVGKTYQDFTCVKRRVAYTGEKIFGWVPTKNLNLLKK